MSPGTLFVKIRVQVRELVKRALGVLVFLVAVLVGLLIYSFTPKKLDVEAYKSGASFVDSAKPTAEVSLTLLNTGKMISSEVFTYRGGSPGKTYESGMAAALVRHPKGDLMIDAGFGRNVDQHVDRMPALMQWLASYVKEVPAADQMQRAGIDPRNIKQVIITHSHWDHISGLEDFPGVEVLMPPAELEFIRLRRMPGLIDDMIGKLNVRTFNFTEKPYENFTSSYDLFGDGTVVAVPLPGHTDGSLGVFVNLPSGKRFFFTGDLTWSEEGLTLPAERPWLARRLVDYGEEEVRRSIVRVHELMKKYPEMIVVPAHDRRVHELIASLPKYER